jgi:3-dehydroquinate dehydratase-2
LNLLGAREPEIYGRTTLDDIKKAATARATQHGLTLDFRQSNTEGEIIEWIQGARGKADGIIINAAGYTHTSVAIMDALAAADQPVIEVHISNVFKREEFRHNSFISRVATGVICGLGSHGYLLAIDAMAELSRKTPA